MRQWPENETAWVTAIAVLGCEELA
jgi:hypothetical protein